MSDIKLESCPMCGGGVTLWAFDRESVAKRWNMRAEG